MVVVFDLPDPALYDLAAGKAHVAEPIVYPAGTIVAIFFDPGFDIVLVRIELTASFSPQGGFKSKFGLVDVLFDGVAADAQLASYGPLLQPSSVQRQDVQYGLLFFI
jgi:hypothetical protein